jgi:hypothetical protein
MQSAAVVSQSHDSIPVASQSPSCSIECGDSKFEPLVLSWWVQLTLLILSFFPVRLNRAPGGGHRCSSDNPSSCVVRFWLIHPLRMHHPFLDDTCLLTLSSICDAEFQVALLSSVASLPSLFGPPRLRAHHSAQQLHSKCVLLIRALLLLQQVVLSMKMFYSLRKWLTKWLQCWK